jgi:hypothetical protein
MLPYPLLPSGLSTLNSSITRTSAELPAKTHRPVLLRPVIGVTVSLVGRDSHDYHQDSVARGVSTRRPSRLPYAMNVIDRRRDTIHHLASTPCARLSAATVQTNRPHYGRTFFRLSDHTIALLTETWVSDFTGAPFPVTLGFPRSRCFLDGDWCSTNSGFPISVNSCGHLLESPTSPRAAFLPGSASPWRFRSFRVREMSLRGSGSFPQPSMRAIQ